MLQILFKQFVYSIRCINAKYVKYKLSKLELYDRDFISMSCKYFHTTSTFWIFDPESGNCLKYSSRYYIKQHAAIP